MTDANEVMNLFMKRLSNGEFEKENLPNDGPEINNDFIEKKLESYSMLLKSGIVSEALDEGVFI